MRDRLFEDFGKQAREASRYFYFLKNLEQETIQLGIGSEENRKIRKVDDELVKTLKATGYLLLYNLVESTLRNAIQAIFDEINSNGISFDEIRPEIQSIVCNNLINNREKVKKSTSLFFEKDIRTISIDIMNTEFNTQNIFSGNIDAKEIRENLAPKYGFSSSTDKSKTRDGIDLLNIKTNRNILAHGNKSFNEVGQSHTAEELLNINKRVTKYLKQILENIETYLDNQEYLSP